MEEKLDVKELGKRYNGVWGVRQSGLMCVDGIGEGKR